MQSFDEKVWQAVEIGWTKPKEASGDWDDAKIKATNFNSRALNALFSAVTNGSSSKQPMKEPRLSMIQSFKGLPQALKRLRWRRMSHSMSSMPSSRT